MVKNVDWHKLDSNLGQLVTKTVTDDTTDYYSYAQIFLWKQLYIFCVLAELHTKLLNKLLNCSIILIFTTVPCFSLISYSYPQFTTQFTKCVAP